MEAKTTSQSHSRKYKDVEVGNEQVTSCNKANGHANADVTDVMHSNISSPAGLVHGLQSQEFSKCLQIKTVTNQLPFCSDQKQEAAAAKPPFKKPKKSPQKKCRKCDREPR